MSQMTEASQEEDNLKRKSDDVGLEYDSQIDASKLDQVKFIVCNHVSTGCVYHMKHNVAHVGNVVVVVVNRQMPWVGLR
jgi:hypothetical protein